MDWAAPISNRVVGGTPHGAEGANRISALTFVRAASIWGSNLAATAIIPAARGVGLADAWVGIEARAEDDVPILGPVPGLDGLVVATGFSGHGFQLSPAIGQVIGELIVEGAPSIPLDALHLARFATPIPPPQTDTMTQRIG